MFAELWVVHALGDSVFQFATGTNREAGRPGGQIKMFFRVGHWSEHA